MTIWQTMICMHVQRTCMHVVGSVTHSRFLVLSLGVEFCLLPINEVNTFYKLLKSNLYIAIVGMGAILSRFIEGVLEINE